MKRQFRKILSVSWQNSQLPVLRLRPEVENTTWNSSGTIVYTPIVSWKSVHLSRRSINKIYNFFNFFAKFREKFFFRMEFSIIIGSSFYPQEVFSCSRPCKFWTIILLCIALMIFIDSQSVKRNDPNDKKHLCREFSRVWGW